MVKIFICFSDQIARKTPNRRGDPNVDVKTKVQGISFERHLIIFIVSGHSCIGFYNDHSLNLFLTMSGKGKGVF